MNRFLAPFHQPFRNLTSKQKVIGIIYFPLILVSWYGYYVWIERSEHEFN